MKSITTLAISILIFMGLIGCKKNNIEMIQIKNNESVSEKVKTWFESSQLKNANSGIEILGKGDPDWNNTMFYPDEKMYVINVNLEKQSKAKKYIVLRLDDKGSIINGQYTIVINKEGTTTSDENLTRLKLYNGVVLNYQLNNSTISSKHFENGKEINKKDFIVYKIPNKEDSGDPNVVNPNEECTENGGQWQCIDWYWQTYVNGELVYEEYLYTTCGCYGGSGGGGGTTSNCENLTQQQAQMLVNAISGEAQYNLSANYGPSVFSEETGMITRTNNPMWMFYKVNFFLGLYVEYTAYFTGVCYKNNINDFWKWQNIAFSSVSKSGGTLPMCFGHSYTQTISDPIISGDQKKAHATITSFTVTYTLTCAFGTETETKNITGLESDFNAAN